MYKIKLLETKSTMSSGQAQNLGIIKSNMIPDVGKSLVYKGDTYKTMSVYYEVDDNDELIMTLIIYKIKK